MEIEKMKPGDLPGFVASAEMRLHRSRQRLV